MASLRKSVLVLCSFVLIWLPMVAAAEGLVTFNFQDVDIRSVIKSVAKLTGKSFVVDPKVKGKVTIVSSESMSEDEIYGVFLSVLQVHDFAAVEVGSIVKIIPQVNAKQDMVRAYVGEDSPERPEDRAVTRLYKLKHVPADKLVPILRPLIAPKSYLAAHSESNMIIIADRAGNIERLVQIIDRIDQEGTGEIQIIRLKYADARDVAMVIQGLESKASPKGAAGQDLQLIADERTNSVLLSGEERHMLRAKTLIAHLDTPVEREGSTQVIFLRFARAKDLVPILSGLDTEGSPQPVQRGRKVTTAANVKRGEVDVNIMADEGTNALIITAPPSTMKSLQAVIRQLDIRRDQVLIEAVIAEVTADKTAEFGIQWRSTQGLGAENGALGGTNFNGGQGINSLSVNPLASALDGFSLGYFRGTTEILGQEIINLGALVRALEGDGDTNILSTPSLVTMDNEEAEITVGQNVPFVTGSYTSTGTGSNPTNPFQTIERKDVGLKLKVLPQISEGDTIRLDIEQETSSLAQDTLSQGLITNTRTIKTSIMVEDGNILVLGGLISDDVNENIQKVPLLGDIPLLGALFRYTRTSHKKKNLMVFLRPVIMRDAAANSRITFDKYDYMRRLQLDRHADGIPLMRGEEQPVMEESPAPEDFDRELEGSDDSQ